MTFQNIKVKRFSYSNVYMCKTLIKLIKIFFTFPVKGNERLYMNMYNVHTYHDDSKDFFFIIPHHIKIEIEMFVCSKCY